MLRVLLTFKLAIRDVKSNLMHTLLSVLGIVIGVGALVAILSMIDGMEEFANSQISKTTSLEAIFINTSTTKRVDNITVEKDDYAYFDYDSYSAMLETLDDETKGFMIYRETGMLTIADTSSVAVGFRGVLETTSDRIELKAGRYFKKDEIIAKSNVVILNEFLANRIANGDSLSTVLGRVLVYDSAEFKVVGVIDGAKDTPIAFVPITIFSKEKLRKSPAECIVWAPSVEKVEPTKQKIEEWLETKFGDKKSDFRVMTNQYRVKQASQGFLLFRIIMGLIVGISVLVGGIGVMNVLLISVTERTSEIGVKKAVGAKRRDIVVQFLSESVTISVFGSVLGVLLGIGVTLLAVPIIKHFTQMPFEAAYTFNTLVVISIISILVGIVFGTYPALKAAKLDPVEAIRRE